MKKLYVIVLLIATTLSSISQTREVKEMFKNNGHGCKAGKNAGKLYIPPPQSYYDMKTKRTEPKCDIIVEYNDFPVLAQEAFEYAVSIWESIISSPIPIRVTAHWRELDEGVLGSCTPYSYYSSFAGALKPDVQYPVALAEKLHGDHLNYEENPDLIASFSSKVMWYLKTDGMTPYGQYDFVTVVLHEIGHGLGFTGGAYSDTDENKGYWDVGQPYYFDTFITNNVRQSIRDTNVYENGTNQLYKQFTNNSMYFRSPVVLNSNNNMAAKLYAPPEYDPGSSIYHLDEYTYDDTENSLMTPWVSDEQGVHDPGYLTEAIFSELGWQRTYIEHDTLTDTEDLHTPFEVKAKIFSDVEYQPETIKFHFFDITNNVSSETSMNYDESTNEYSALIPAPGVESVFGYYITVTDELRQNFYPGYPPEQIYTFFVGADSEKPEIVHKPDETISINATTLKLACQAFDNIGINSVNASFKVNENDAGIVTLDNDSANHYSQILTFNTGDFEANDIISYQIIAVDEAKNPNTGVYPSVEDYYEITVTEALTEYLNAFDDNEFDFTGNDFEITHPDGFDNNVLTSEYEEAGEGNYIDYIAQLKYPIILRNDSAWMQFDEVVLVEPGEEGATFESDNFYDYVIVEGSKDNGETWHEFEPGYDAGRYNAWKNHYNSRLFYGESRAEGSKELFKRNSVNLYGYDNYFEGGDEILIRFRLHSDPYSVGWGWAIDSLKIQTGIYSVLSNIRQKPAFETQFDVYPNPAKDMIHIKAVSNTPMKQAVVEFYTIDGRKIHTQSYHINAKEMQQKIDVSNFKSGLYIIKLQTDKTVNSSKILLL